MTIVQTPVVEKSILYSLLNFHICHLIFLFCFSTSCSLLLIYLSLCQHHTLFIILSRVSGNMWKYALFIMVYRALPMWHPFFSRLISHSHICSRNSKRFSPLLSHTHTFHAIPCSWRTNPLIHTRNCSSSFQGVLSFTLSDRLFSTTCFLYESLFTYAI